MHKCYMFAQLTHPLPSSVLRVVTESSPDPACEAQGQGKAQILQSTLLDLQEGRLWAHKLTTMQVLPSFAR